MNKNKTILDGKRIALSSTSLEILEAEVKRIKEKGAYYKINEAKLASLIIELFCSKYLRREREQIEESFFDKKTSLKMLIEKSSSDDELSKFLNEFLSTSKMKKEKKSRTTEDDNSGVKEE